MTSCPTCGRAIPAALFDGRLTATETPLIAEWEGRRLALSMSHKRALALLVKRGGQASREALEQVAIGPSAGPDHLNTVIWQLRQRLAAGGVPLTVRHIRDFGYELVEIPDDTPDEPAPDLH